jgi:hypothetical protein
MILAAVLERVEFRITKINSLLIKTAIDEIIRIFERGIEL